MYEVGSVRFSVKNAAADTPVLQLQRYVQRMSGIIDGLLEFARAGAQPQPGQHATVGVILRDTVEALSPEAEEAGVALRLEGDADVAVACAPGMVTSVVTNLARNALKYIHAAHRADPRITLRVREHGDHVRVEVEDTGPGIPREAQESMGPRAPLERPARQRARPRHRQAHRRGPSRSGGGGVDSWSRELLLVRAPSMIGGRCSKSTSSRWLRRRARGAGVSFSVARARRWACFGESGCGKSSLARALVGLVPDSKGSIRFAGPARKLQLVFQDRSPRSTRA